MPTLYLIPSALSDTFNNDYFANYYLNHLRLCAVLFTEHARTTRRYLKKLDPAIDLNYFEWVALHRHEKRDPLPVLTRAFSKGQNAGVLSDAGCPCIADPGEKIVRHAHTLGARVMPLVGANAFLLALMASGLPAQRFAFHGYLPTDKDARVRAIKQIEKASRNEHATQGFMDTPYRNHLLFMSLLQCCHERTLLCVAYDITGQQEWIETRTIGQWKAWAKKNNYAKSSPDALCFPPKLPCVFWLCATH